MNNQHLAEEWHWIAIVLAIVVLLAWFTDNREVERASILLLLCWESVGVYGHYWLRTRK